MIRQRAKTQGVLKHGCFPVVFSFAIKTALLNITE